MNPQQVLTKHESAEIFAGHMVVSQSIILIMGTPQRVPLILGNPHILSILQLGSCEGVEAALSRCLTPSELASAEDGGSGIKGFPKIRNNFLGVPIIRNIVFGVFFWVFYLWKLPLQCRIRSRTGFWAN